MNSYEGFGINSAERVERLVKGRIPESPSLDYKRELHLGKREERREFLKDVTGMGNGGGGTVLLGVDEDPRNSGIPVGVTPLADRGIVGQAEDIMRSAVRPPLLAEPRVIEIDGGFCLAIEVLPSPLGPYMIEAYGESRFYTRTMPMDEQQVRDAYTLATRGREGREQLWQRHSLPLQVASERPWLTLSALPEEPLIEIFDPTSMPLEELRHPDEMRDLAIAGGFESVNSTPSLKLWVEGVYGDDGFGEREPEAVLRLHRDGAAAIGMAMPLPLPYRAIPRALNAQLAYLGWLWTKLGLRTPVEIRAQLGDLRRATIQEDWPPREQAFREPPGVDVPGVDLVRELTAHQLRRPSIRHAFVRDFADRLMNAYGHDREPLMFRVGWLYGPDGLPLGLSIGGTGIWTGEGRQAAVLYSSGRIGPTRGIMAGVIGYLVDGVVLDEQGRAMAATEMAPGTGLPDDFLQRRLTDRTKYVAPEGGDSPFPEKSGLALPHPTGEWSTESLPSRLTP